MKCPRLIALEFSLCMRPIQSVWLSKAVLWSIKERPLCWAWEWHFIDIKNSLMAKWFGFDPAVKRLERPEAQAQCHKNQRKKKSFLTLIMQFWKPSTTKEENYMVILFYFLLLSIFPQNILLLFFSLHDLQFIWFFSFFSLNVSTQTMPQRKLFKKMEKQIWKNTAKKLIDSNVLLTCVFSPSFPPPPTLWFKASIHCSVLCNYKIRSAVNLSWKK